jgi:hypothetical protein
MSRRRKKRNGRPARRRQVDQRKADLDRSKMWLARDAIEALGDPKYQFSQRDADLIARTWFGYRDMRDMRHKHKVEELKWRTGWRRALDEWRTKWRPAAQKYKTPRKLRGKDRSKRMWLVRDAIRLIEDYPHYFELTFWHDLEKRGVDFPYYLPFLLWALSREPSELLRAIADYIDAYKAREGARLKATEKLYGYAEQVMSRRAKKLNWREIKERYYPDYPRDGDGSYRNFQKFLRERGIPKQDVGEFRGTPRKCVQKQKKDTQLPRN